MGVEGVRSSQTGASARQLIGRYRVFELAKGESVAFIHGNSVEEEIDRAESNRHQLTNDVQIQGGQNGQERDTFLYRQGSAHCQ